MADRLGDRPHLAIQLPTILGPAVPGAHVTTVYGVRIIVEPDKAPVISEQRGNPGGHATFRALVEHAVPAGTKPDRYAQ
ncbi:hypothetical protein [Nonomuraea sp. NPDC049141]|uniref:hypothetical protein n=1 Tax=Nonomuraea sp. NPDC049141 TaxID=3155500 RepID=UPI0033E2CD2E